jgi:hypothetical protein
MISLTYTFQTWRDVRLESVIRAKADVHQHVWLYELTATTAICMIAPSRT